MNKKILFLLLLLYSITYSFSEVIWVHPNTMNITNSTGGDIFNVNDTINFTALPVDSLANDILNKGYIKWDFGDLTETDYGRYIKITHKYLFPFIYPVAWCGYLNNSDYTKSLTFNWIVVGDPKNVTYIFNGSPNNPKDSWSVEYNKSSNLVVINYYFDRNVNKNFTGINLGGELATISVDHNNIVAGDNVTFSYSIDKNIIFQMWSFGDGTISFEKSPTHTYKNPGFYFPRVLLVDDNGYIYVGYYRIYVKRPIGGYFEPIRNMSYVYNSSGAVNIEDIYAMAYKVGDNIIFEPKGYAYTYYFGDAVTHFNNFYFEHVYEFPFIYPIYWEGKEGNTYYYPSATLDYLVVGDVGNTIYNIIPTSNDMNTFFKSYDPKNHVVELYSKIINKSITLKLKQKIHYDVIVHATETNNGIQYSYLYPYGTPVLVFWNFGDGSYSLDPNPIHYYNGDNEYQASVMIIDKNGVVSVGFGPVVRGNRIVNSMLYVEPTVVQPNQTINIYYVNPTNYTYLNLSFKDWEKNYITNKIKDTLDPKPDYYIYDYYYNIIGVGYDVSNIKSLTISFKIPWEGIYYVEGNDSVLHSFVPRMIKVIDDKPPIAKLYVYPNPAYSFESVYFNPLNSYDPDANRVLNNSGGYIISPNEPAAKIYGFNLTVYNSSGEIVWRYTSNSLKIVSHRFDPGNYTAKLVVWDGFGKRGESEVNFTVIYKIYGLKPDFDYKYIGNYTMEFIDTSIVFPGSIIKRIWNFGDGSVVETNNLVVEHKYNKSGFYLVTLTVFTNTNLKGSISKIIYVPESQILYPKADFTFKVLNNLTVIFNASSSYSPNGDIVKYIWNFGDNSSLTSNNPIVEHKYNKPGIYLVTLTVVDNKGLSDSCGKYVNVNNENILSIPIPLYVKLLVMVITLLSIFMISKWLK